MIYTPQALIAIRPTTKILSWDHSPGAVGYNLLQSMEANGVYRQLNSVPIPPAPQVTFSIMGAPGTRYYKVQAFDVDGNTSESDPIPVTLE